MKKLFLILPIVGLSVGSLFAQNSGQGPAFSLEAKMANYYPVSPSSSRLMQEVNYPVNYCTGAVGVSIPIYEIKTRDFTLPIALKCKTTGIRASETWYSWVGVGWNLEVEPTITREIRGKADENGYLIYDTNFASDDKAYLLQVAKGDKDTKPDIFYFKTLFNSGKFVFKRPENPSENMIYQPLFFPASAEKILVIDNLSKLKMYDEIGNLYVYGEAENSTETTYSPSNTFISTWKASSIISPQHDEILFSYIRTNNDTSMPGIQDSSGLYDFYGVEDMQDDPLADAPVPETGYWKGVSGNMNYYHSKGYERHEDGEYYFDEFEYYTSGVYDVVLPIVTTTTLSRIDFAGGYVDFITENNLLRKIKIYEENTLLRTVEFSYALYEWQTNQFQLSQLVFIDNLTMKKQVYTFEYYQPWQRFSLDAKNLDYWGFYNYHTENTDLVPRQTINIGLPSQFGYYGKKQIGGANREPDNGSEVYSLREIAYPSGEIDHFTYELNQYQDLKTLKKMNAGGLRIRQLSTYDSNRHIKKAREFAYGEDGSGNIWIPPTKELYQENHTRVYSYWDHTVKRRYRIYRSNPCMSLFFMGGAPVLYNKVKEVTFDYSTYPVNRKEVEYYYHNASNYTATATQPLMFIQDYLDDWEQNELTNIKSYNLYYGYMAWEKCNNYEIISLPPNVDLRTKVFDAYMQTIVEYCGGYPEDISIQEVYFDSYDLEGKKRKVLKTTQEIIKEDIGDAIKKEKKYDYGISVMDVKTGFPISELEVNSDGSHLSKFYTYPYHRNTNVCQWMVEDNILSRVLEEKYVSLSADSVQKNKIITNSFIPLSCGYLSYKHSAIQESDSVLTRMKNVEIYHSYDKCGNLIEYRRKDGTAVTLLWGYNYQRLIAQIVGSNLDSVISSSDYNNLQNMSGKILEDELQNIRSRVTGLMTTFIWYPTRGVAIKTDPMGISTYYNYDGYGRLINVRDMNRKILETYDYNTKK